MTERKSGFRAKNAGLSVAIIVAMVISGFAMVAAPVTVAQDETVGGPYGGELRVALKSQPSSLSPLATNLNESATQLIDLLYESLARIDPYTLETEPWMASSWTVNATNKNIVTVFLKEGIMWHDGTEVTPADVRYSFGPNGYDLDYVASMSINNATSSIVFTLTTPDSRFYSDLLLKKIVPEGFTASSAANGCGPFELVSTNSTTTILDAFDSHFNARPFVDRLIYTYYPYNENYNAALYPYEQNFATDPRFNGFYRAAYDLINNRIDYIGWDLTTDDLALNIEVNGNNTNLLFNANATSVRSNGLKQWYLGFNNAPDHFLSDPALRKAISYCIDKGALEAYDESGGLEKSNSIISKYNLPWYNSSVSYHGYDEAYARKILNDAKYMDYNSDGYIDKPGPVTPNVGYENISLTLYGPANADVTLTLYTMSTNIISWLEILGVKTTLVSNTTDVHMPNILADNFDMYLSFEESVALDPQFMNDLFHSDSIATDKNLVNFEGTYDVDNYSLKSQIKDNTVWTAQLDHTCIADPIAVYHNGTKVANSTWSLDRDTGLFTLVQTFSMDYVNDTLNISYSYRPFDHYANKANAEMDMTTRAKYIKDAQAVLADLEPSIPLFSYRVSHAYRVGIYIGWVQTLGGINNYWSFANIQNKVIGDSEADLSSVKNYINAGEQMNLFVKVQDSNGGAITGSSFAFTGEGTFGTPVYDDAGQYTISYTAPATAASRTITLGVSAYTVGYTSSSDSMEITVHPKVNSFSVDITRGATTLLSGNDTSLSIQVLDSSDSSAVSGASVVITMTPTGLGGYIEEMTGTTDSAGEFVTTFGSANVTVDTTFRITAYVTKTGYEDAVQTTSISVSRDPDIESTTDKGFLGLPAPSFMTVLILLSAMAIVYSAYRRRKQ